MLMVWLVCVYIYIWCLKLDKVPLDPFNTMLEWTSSDLETMLPHFNLIMFNERRNSTKIPQTKVNNISIETFVSNFHVIYNRWRTLERNMQMFSVIIVVKWLKCNKVSYFISSCYSVCSISSHYHIFRLSGLTG